MIIKIARRHFSETATEGDLFVDGVFECYTVEDRAIDWKTEKKVKGKTAIPCGRYRVALHNSPRFRKVLPWLKDVPGFDYILIHSGNSSKDTEGCIIVGAQPTKRTDDFVGESRKAFDKLFPRIKAAIERGDEVWVTIVEERPKPAKP